MSVPENMKETQLKNSKSTTKLQMIATEEQTLKSRKEWLGELKCTDLYTKDVELQKLFQQAEEVLFKIPLPSPINLYENKEQWERFRLLNNSIEDRIKKAQH